MRSYGLILAALPLAALPAGAQQGTPAQGAPAQAAPAQAAPAPGAAALDTYLRRWEQAMQKVQTLSAQLVRIDKDRTFDDVRKLAGYAAYMKSGTGPTALHMAVLEMRPVDKKTGEVQKEFLEKFLCTGTFAYQFLPAQKEIKVYELAKPKPGQEVSDDNFLGFLLGMKAEEAKRRYDLKLAKEDQYYIYVDIVPRFAADRADFQRARLVLNKDSFLPRQLWFEHSNGNEVTWDIPRLENGARLERRLFDAPQVPPGWKQVQVPRPAEPQPQPRVIRQSPPAK